MKKASILIVFLVILGMSQGEMTCHAQEEPALVTENEYDRTVIPDKYNTGAKGELIRIEPEAVFYLGDTKVTYRKLDLFYQKTPVPDELILENYDFSASDFSVQNAGKLDIRSIHLIFKICKF